MKGLLWIALFVAGLLGVVVPGVYLYTASKLPRLDSDYDLHAQFRPWVEGERMSDRAGKSDRDPRPLAFEKPRFEQLPRELVALYISQLGCPTFFQTPREEGLAWAWRMFAGTYFDRELSGDGGCERTLAMNLARRLASDSALDVNVAANKVHGILQKDQLVAWDFATIKFDRGVVGIDDAAWALFRKKLPELSLAELAEFTLALPMNGFYSDIKQCKNAPLIRKTRDLLIKRVAAEALISSEQATRAMKLPVACLDAP